MTKKRLVVILIQLVTLTASGVATTETIPLCIMHSESSSPSTSQTSNSDNCDESAEKSSKRKTVMCDKDDLDKRRAVAKKTIEAKLNPGKDGKFFV